MNKTRCSLDPQNVTMLVCLRDWLRKNVELSNVSAAGLNQVL